MAGETITIDTGANLESAVIATVGPAGATTVEAAGDTGATVVTVFEDPMTAHGR
jgi:non-reducing end alpha-L-arabinofuranosidase